MPWVWHLPSPNEVLTLQKWHVSPDRCRVRARERLRAQESPRPGFDPLECSAMIAHAGDPAFTGCDRTALGAVMRARRDDPHSSRSSGAGGTGQSVGRRIVTAAGTNLDSSTHV